MADPAPVAQTFFVDESVQECFRLDGIVTLVDAKHIEQHLDEEKAEGAENEAVEQVLPSPTGPCSTSRTSPRLAPHAASLLTGRLRGPAAAQQGGLGRRGQLIT